MFMHAVHYLDNQAGYRPGEDDADATEDTAAGNYVRGIPAIRVYLVTAWTVRPIRTVMWIEDEV